MKARFLPAAEAEFLKEIGYYANAREGVGRKFERAVEAAVHLALGMPDGGAPGLLGTRSRLVRGFPFSVIYRIDPQVLLIIAVANHRRMPAYWARRVE